MKASRAVARQARAVESLQGAMAQLQAQVKGVEEKLNILAGLLQAQALMQEAALTPQPSPPAPLPDKERGVEAEAAVKAQPAPAKAGRKSK